MMAFTQREQRVLDLRDQGLAPAEIAARLNISRRAAERIVYDYCDCPSVDRANQTTVIEGSRALLAAMVAAGQTLRPRCPQP